MKVGIVLTQWKRSNLERQLKAISEQTLQPDFLVVFQNENWVDITPLKEKYEFIHVKSDHNTKYFGRFAYFFTLPVDICIVMDDDIIPGKNCIKNYVDQCVAKNAIIGGNGRIGLLSPHRGKARNTPDVGFRRSTKVDFIGHLWCFKKDWLYYMFGTKPYTYDTGEDMHLCFSSKVHGNIESFVGEQLTRDDLSDTAGNGLAGDKFASFRTTKKELRMAVEQYWVDKGLKFIKEN